MEMSMVKTKIIATAENGSEWIKDITNKIYQNPELGFCEQKVLPWCERHLKNCK